LLIAEREEFKDGRLSLYAFRQNEWLEKWESAFSQSAAAWTNYTQEIDLLSQTNVMQISFEDADDSCMNVMSMHESCFSLNFKNASGSVINMAADPSATFSALLTEYKNVVQGQDDFVFYFDGEKLDLHSCPIDFEMQHEDCIEVKMKPISPTNFKK
jgi:hypothetical protein